VAEEAAIVYSRAQLAERLATWPGNDGVMTWGLVVVGAVPTASELAAAKEAGHLCDKVVAVRLEQGKAVPVGYAEALRAAGVDMVWVVREISGEVRVDVGVEEPRWGKDGGTALVQAITTVLPQLVVASRGHLGLVRMLRAILDGLGDLFVLRLVD
jgi:hypothetical protein